jgi:hypothetical protein
MRVDLRAQKPDDGFTEQFRLRYSFNHKPCVKVFNTLDEAKEWANTRENLENSRVSRFWVPPSGLIFEYSPAVREAVIEGGTEGEDSTMELPVDLITIQMPEPRDEWRSIGQLDITGFYAMLSPDSELVYHFERGAYSGANILLPHVRDALSESTPVTWQLTTVPIETIAQWQEINATDLTWAVAVRYKALTIDTDDEAAAHAIVSSFVNAWDRRFMAIMYLAMPFEDTPQRSILEGGSKTFAIVGHDPYDSLAHASRNRP